jgi:hypothetical protein
VEKMSKPMKLKNRKQTFVNQENINKLPLRDNKGRFIKATPVTAQLESSEEIPPVVVTDEEPIELVIKSRPERPPLLERIEPTVWHNALRNVERSAQWAEKHDGEWPNNRARTQLIDSVWIQKFGEPRTKKAVKPKVGFLARIRNWIFSKFWGTKHAKTN